MNSTNAHAHIAPQLKDFRVIKLLGSGAIFIFAIFLIAMEGTFLKLVADNSKLLSAASNRSSMEGLARQGKPEAILWLSNKYPGSYLEQLKPLADSGNAEALFHYAGSLIIRGKKAEALGLIKQSAKSGYQPAIRFLDVNARMFF